MTRRPIALFVSIAFVLTTVCTTAGRVEAQEIRVATPLIWVTPDGSPAIRHSLAAARMRAEQSMPFQLDPPVKEVRLSSGAKTAIIVTAIVVGALIIVGAVALGRPGKKLP